MKCYAKFIHEYGLTENLRDVQLNVILESVFYIS